MKYPISLLLLLSFFLQSCQFSKNSTEAPIKADDADNSTPLPEENAPTFPDWDDRSALKSGLILLYQNVLDEMPDATIYHLDLNIDDDLIHITGSQEVRYTNQEDIALDEVYFHLMPNYLGEEMLVSMVQINGEDADFALEMRDTALRVPLESSLAIGESVLIKIDFVTTVPARLESNYGILASTEGVLALAHAYPMVAVYDDEGWNIDIPSEQGDVTYLDMSFYFARVNAPKDLVLVASGNEITHKSTGDRQVALYAAAPARDFYIAASEEYVHIQEDFGNYVINAYTPKNMENGAEMAIEVAAASIDFFSEQFAPYPYTEFDIAATPTYALGIEYPGMTAIRVGLFDLGTEVNGTPASIYLESTIAHEVGHQWFYHLVGNDQLDEPWLDESLTQYITWQYYLNQHGNNGGAGFAQALDGRWRRVDHAQVPLGLPVSAYEDAEYGAIIYGRGAFFFEALEEEMGEDVFDAFLADYTQSQVWGIASTESLREIAEKHCNCDLEGLFERWIYPVE
ncbi:MAG: M1 family metallopeptidase [Chloroflexi bacterium]|nr:M1 family metallopeptidase [Chloroflexota bacterium]